jgi:hypothetical protein
LVVGWMCMKYPISKASRDIYFYCLLWKISLSSPNIVLLLLPHWCCAVKICQELKTIPHQLSTHVPYILSYSLSFTFDHQAVIQTSLPVYQDLVKYILPPPTSAFHSSPLITTLVACTCIIHPYIPMQLVLSDWLWRWRLWCRVWNSFHFWFSYLLKIYPKFNATLDITESFLVLMHR